MKLNFKKAAVLLVAAAALSACGGGNKGPQDTRLVDSFVASEKTAGAYGDSSWNADVYQANLFEDGIYQLIHTQVSYGYNMILGTSSFITYGTYEKGNVEDGVAAYTLNAAAEVLMKPIST